MHQEQRRKSRSGEKRIPYIVHLLGVCAIVLENGGGETEAIAALLHDAIEDQGGEAQARRIGELFGADVERIVRGCTDSFADTSAGEPKAPYAERKLSYLERLRSEPDDVALVSAADKLDNARATARNVTEQGEDAWAIFRAPKPATIAYYRALIAVYRSKGPRLARIVDELDEIVARLGAGVPDVAFEKLLNCGG
jgi:(p)ppGpp synthase/HD superfamily hydrolase